MITLIICICIIISVAIICYTYYKIKELKECLVSDNIDAVNTLETITCLIDTYSKRINDQFIHPTGYINVESINTFNKSIKAIINNKTENYDEY